MNDRITRLVSNRDLLAASVLRATTTAALIGQQQQGLNKAPLRALVEAMLGTLLLTTRLKGRGMLILQLDTDGIFDRLRVDGIGLGYVRAAVPLATSERLRDHHDHEPLFGTGTLSISRQLEGDSQVYASTIAVEGGEVPAMLAAFVRDSEQAEARMHLDVRIEGDQVQRANGIYVERVSGAPDEAVRRVHDLARIAAAPLADEVDDLAVCDLCFDGGFTRLMEYPLRFHCPCSRERFETALRNCSPAERRQLADPDHIIRPTCDFCRSSYEVPL